jgi:diaminohydroxyphosphoribosylaminopyrimidine deaminase/5-amino-6-(5-phosphoribosylamino)uracil reductase
VRLTAQQLGIDGDVMQPHRVVLDSQLRFPSSARMLALDGKTTVLTTVHDNGGLPCDVVRLEQADGRLDLDSVMRWLAAQQANEVHVEAGATLCGALLEHKLVDEIVVYVAPHIMGSDARGLFTVAGLDRMADRIKLDIRDVRQVGRDLRISAVPLND